MRLILIALVVLLSLTPATFAQQKKRPNVLFLFTDDQRADTIAALGNKHIKTPNLDRLVQRGTAFTRAYCMGAMQGAVCVPSRAMVMSGRTLFRVNEKLQGMALWPTMFARAGYRTFMTGKWHNQEASALAAFAEGKGIFFGGMGNPYALPIADITPKRTLTEKKLTGKHSVALFADNAIEFIQEQKGADKPFVAYVAFNGPHDPRTAPKEYHEPYNKNKPPLPPNFLPVHPFNNGDMIGRDERLAPWPRTKEVVQQHLADYYAYITYLDAQIGRILEALREAGLEDDTIIVFASDSGLAVGSHGLFGKQSVYDHSMRSPLIFAGPGVPKGKTSDAFCYLLDIFPTLGALAGVQGPEANEGKSLVPIMKGEATQVRDSIFLAYRQFQRAVREDRWKIIVYPHINKVQLFDMQNDPHEIKDLSGDPANAGHIERLTLKLKDWQKKLGDTQPLRSANPAPADFDFSKVPPAKKKKAALLPPPLRGRGPGGERAGQGLSHGLAALTAGLHHPPIGMSYLDNGTIKLGVDLKLGGAITYLSPAKEEKNVVNNFDFGRQIQMSYYAGPVPFIVGDKEPTKHWRHLGWNPIQSGDDFKNPSKVLESKNDGKTLYVKCIPMQWPLDNEPGECSFECWIRLDGATARVKCRLNNERGDATQYAARTQEMPAVYTNAPYYRLMTYTGSKPFGGDKLTQIVRPEDHKGPWVHWLATENWAAHVDERDWGLGVWHSGVYRFSGGFAGKPGRGGSTHPSAGYIAPHRQEVIDHNIRHEYEYVLVLGKLDDIRAHVVKHARRPAPPSYDFRADRQGWYYVNARDTGWPISGELKMLLEKDDPQMIAPATFFASEDAPKCRIEAAFSTREKIGQLFWTPFEAVDFTEECSVRFPIVGDGTFRVYEVDLSKSDKYQGTIVGLRFDPIPVGNTGDWMRIKSITFGK